MNVYLVDEIPGGRVCERNPSRDLFAHLSLQPMRKLSQTHKKRDFNDDFQVKVTLEASRKENIPVSLLGNRQEIVQEVRQEVTAVPALERRERPSQWPHSSERGEKAARCFSGCTKGKSLKRSFMPI